MEKTKDWDHAARIQVNGYGKLVVGICRKIVRIKSNCLEHLTKIQFKKKNNNYLWNANYLCDPRSRSGNLDFLERTLADSHGEKEFVSRDESKQIDQFGSFELSES